ncbi:MAG: hypothetical protein B6241_10680 [Spirochaetaceae bacterium 4572_59]|nr:MAG: hypothetical protein B6241_10680 [Spirochaetaceae bacterium 4572_59]
MKLRNKLILIISFIIFVVLLVTSISSYFVVKNIVIESALFNLEAVSNGQLNYLENMDQLNKDRLKLVSSRTQLRLSLKSYLRYSEIQDQSRMNKILKDALSSIKDYNEISIINLSGIVVSSTEAGSINEKSNDNDYFSKAEKGEITDHFFLDDDQNLIIHVYGPIIYDGEMIGVIRIAVSEEKIMSMLRDYSLFGNTGYFSFLIPADEENKFIATPRRIDGDDGKFKYVYYDDLGQISKKVIEKQIGTYRHLDDYRNNSFFAVVSYSDVLDFGYSVRMSREEVLKPLVYYKKILFSVVILLLLMMLSIFPIGVAAVTKPIIRLAELTKNVSEGKLDQEIEVFSNDEIGILGNSLNVMREHIKESKERYQTIIETTSQGFILVDSEMKIIEVNQSLCDMTAYTRDELIGKPSLDFINEENEIIFNGQIQQITDILHRSYEISLKKKNGETCPTIVNATTLVDEKGNYDGSFGLITDLTDRKRAEAEFQKIDKLESLGTLAGGIAHDFNNILTGIYGYISLLQTQLPENNSSTEYFNEIQKSMKRAVQLSRQLMTFSKEDNAVKENINLGDVIREVIKFNLSGSTLKPVFEESDHLWIVEADKGQIQQVFSNLTINAKQASPEGGHLFVTMQNSEIREKEIPGLESGKYIKIRVQDEGSGIDSKDLDKIFEPYFTTKKFGNGLGLATVYSIIKKHNGHIVIESEIAKGTTFTIFLPAVESQKIDHKCKPVVEAVSKKQLLKILVMDDEEMIRFLFSEILEKIGHVAETVSNGEEAVKKYKESMEKGNRFDIVILDLTIPGGMGGVETVKHILDMNSDAKVIACSGYSNNFVMADFLEYGFKGIISKPFTIEKVTEVINSIS